MVITPWVAPLGCVVSLPAPSGGEPCFMQLGVQFSAAARGSNFRRRFQSSAALVGTVLIALRHPGEWALWEVFLAWLAISVPLAALTEYVATRVRHWRQAEELPRVTAADLEDRFKPQNGTLMAELDASKQREFSAPAQQRDAAQEQAGVAQRQRDDYKQQLEAVQRGKGRRRVSPGGTASIWFSSGSVFLKDFIRRRKSAENVGFWPVLGGLWSARQRRSNGSGGIDPQGHTARISCLVRATRSGRSQADQKRESVIGAESGEKTTSTT